MIRRARKTDIGWMAKKSLPAFNKIYIHAKKLKELKNIISSSVDRNTNQTLVFEDCSAYISWKTKLIDGKNFLIFQNCFSEKPGNGVRLYKKVIDNHKNHIFVSIFHSTENKLQRFFLRNGYKITEHKFPGFSLAVKENVYAS